MDNTETRLWLDSEWRSVQCAQNAEPDPEVDRLVNSNVVSIRYAVITQLLGKIADSKRSLLSLQSGSPDEGAWNARSFCDAVIVPWVSENHNVIGTSAEPYASKPLRRQKLSLDMANVRSKREWNHLVEFFRPLEHASHDKLVTAFQRCLHGLVRKLANQSFTYPIPIRVSLPTMIDSIRRFVGIPSGGLRPLVVTTALLEVLGNGFSLFSSIVSQGVNEADSASGVPGDVMCYAPDGSLALAVEVKDRCLTIADVRSSTRKVMQTEDSLSHFLFATPGIRRDEQEEIAAAINNEWASGLNLYYADVLELAAAAFVLLDETYRPILFRAIAAELDRRGVHQHRQAWYEILAGNRD